MAKVTPKQERFVEHYLETLNATQSAIRAGYSEKNASRIGAELLGKTHVAELIAQGKAKRSEKTGIDATYVLQRLVEIDQMDVIDILADDGALKPVREWPKIWRQFIGGMDVLTSTTRVSDEVEIENILKKIKWPDKVKNLELLGKHVDVQAFKEQRELSGGLALSHEEALEQLE